MLNMEAYLSLYDATKDLEWLERAKAAAYFAEVWIWIWIRNVPVPPDADVAKFHYKKGVPTVGIQGITAAVSGGVDEYLDWAVPSSAKLYKLTKDEHYLDVARVLLHDTKSMAAVPGRQFDVKGIGRQQEGWRVGPGSPQRWRAPVLAAMSFRESPVRKGRAGGIRSRPIQAAIHEAAVKTAAT